jgi:hypothetical protein
LTQNFKQFRDSWTNAVAQQFQEFRECWDQEIGPVQRHARAMLVVVTEDAETMTLPIERADCECEVDPAELKVKPVPRK